MRISPKASPQTGAKKGVKSLVSKGTTLQAFEALLGQVMRPGLVGREAKGLGRPHDAHGSEKEETPAKKSQDVPPVLPWAISHTLLSQKASPSPGESQPKRFGRRPHMASHMGDAPSARGVMVASLRGQEGGEGVGRKSAGHGPKAQVGVPAGQLALLPQAMPGVASVVAWEKAVASVHAPRAEPGSTHAAGQAQGVHVHRVVPAVGGGVLEFELRTERAHSVHMQLEVQGERAKLVCRCEGVYGAGHLQEVLQEIRTIMERAGFDGDRMEFEFASFDSEHGDRAREGAKKGENPPKGFRPRADDSPKTDASSQDTGRIHITGVLWAIA